MRTAARFHKTNAEEKTMKNSVRPSSGPIDQPASHKLTAHYVGRRRPLPELSWFKKIVWVIILTSTTIPPAASAQGLFAQAAAKGGNVAVAYKKVWDDFYGNFGSLMKAEADKTKIVFDAEHGIVTFPVILTVNETAFGEYQKRAIEIVEKELKPSSLLATGEQLSGSEIVKRGTGARFVCGVEIPFAKNEDDKIEALHAKVLLKIPRTGVIVKLVDSNGRLVNYAAVSVYVFNHRGTYWSYSSYQDNQLPLCRMGRWSQVGDSKEPDELASPPRLKSGRDRRIQEESAADFSFAGITKNELDSVADIQCSVLIDPEFTEECRRLRKEKIERDSRFYETHGITTKVFTLPGGIPLAMNKNPKGGWVGRYEVTQDQWTSLMGDNPAVDRRKIDDNKEPWYARKKVSPGMRIDSPDVPVDYVSYNDVQKFLIKLNALPEIASSGFEFHLPRGGRFVDLCTLGETEWEYAAAINTGLVWGGEGSGKDPGGQIAQANRAFPFDPQMGYDLHPVGQLRPNWMGLYDVVGNVSEMQEETKAGPEGTYGGRTTTQWFFGGNVRSLNKEKFDGSQGGDCRGFRLFATDGAGLH